MRFVPLILISPFNAEGALAASLDLGLGERVLVESQPLKTMPALAKNTKQTRVGSLNFFSFISRLSRWLVLAVFGSEAAIEFQLATFDERRQANDGASCDEFRADHAR